MTTQTTSNTTMINIEAQDPSIYKGRLVYECFIVQIDGQNYHRVVLPDGSMAVAISPGYGSGWSSSCDTTVRWQMATDSRFIRFAGDAEYRARYINIKDFIAQNFTEPAILDSYTGGFDNIQIVFVPRGKMFRINEYDGHESIHFFDPNEYITP